METTEKSNVAQTVGADIAFLQEAEQLDGALMGFEDLSRETIAVPFVRIMQAQTPQCDEMSDTYIDGARPGKFFRTLPPDVWAPPVKIVVLFFKVYFIAWRPNRGGFAGMFSPREIDNLTARGAVVKNAQGFYSFSDGTADLQETYTYTCVNVDKLADGPFNFPLVSTQLKEAKKFNFLLRTTRLPHNRPALPYFSVWNMGTAAQKNEKGSWYGVSFAWDRFVTKEELDAIVELRKTLVDIKPDFAAMDDPQQSITSIDDEVPF